MLWAKALSGAARTNVIESEIAMTISQSLPIQPLAAPMEATIRPNSL
jgi:hypothetical protein